MTDVLETERMTLRPPDMGDAADIARAANDIQIARWLTQMPHPYTRADAEEFIARQTSGETFVIHRDGQAIGCIGTKGEFGYWLGRSHWGQGLATEASRAVVTRYFASNKTALTSGHALGNTRSRRVLRKLGFQDTEVVQRAHKITGAVRSQQVMTLSKSVWEARS